MKNDGAIYQTHHFRLRVWREQTDAAAYEWRGQVTSVATGQVRSFRTWEQLVEELRAVVKDEIDLEFNPWF